MTNDGFFSAETTEYIPKKENTILLLFERPFEQTKKYVHFICTLREVHSNA